MIPPRLRESVQAYYDEVGFEHFPGVQVLGSRVCRFLVRILNP